MHTCTYIQLYILYIFILHSWWHKYTDLYYKLYMKIKKLHTCTYIQCPSTLTV